MIRARSLFPLSFMERKKNQIFILVLFLCIVHVDVVVDQNVAKLEQLNRGIRTFPYVRLDANHLGALRRDCGNVGSVVRQKMAVRLQFCCMERKSDDVQ